MNQNKVGIITGASRGIGAQIAINLASFGTSVALIATSSARLLKIKKIIVDNKGSAIVIKADISNFTEVKKAFRQIIKEYGRIDFLINNASVISPIGKILDTDPYEWKKNIKVNLIGGIILSKVGSILDFIDYEHYSILPINLIYI
jgi:NAD(P)-dependent dehydrogenase (short-subunit alcohol dehydrogenase family)